MAQRRMFSLKVVDTDAFCEMPSSAQNLYYHIGMRADDEGFYAGVKGLMAKIHAAKDDLDVLVARGYILDRGDGVYVVKHWRINNLIKIDRFHFTEYEEKRAGLFLKRDGSYTIHEEKSVDKVIQEPSLNQLGTNLEPTWNQNGTKATQADTLSKIEGKTAKPSSYEEEDEMEPKWNQNGTQMEPEVSIGKVSIGKDRLVQVSNKNIVQTSPNKSKPSCISQEGFLVAMLEQYGFTNPTEAKASGFADMFNRYLSQGLSFTDLIVKTKRVMSGHCRQLNTGKSDKSGKPLFKTFFDFDENVIMNKRRWLEASIDNLIRQEKALDEYAKQFRKEEDDEPF